MSREKAAQLEELKQRIAESARKAGLDGEFESVEKSIRRDPPPEAEWWDAALLPRKTYDDLHPIPIPAPGDKPLKLTKKVRESKPNYFLLLLSNGVVIFYAQQEEKKLRKRTRQIELQDPARRAQGPPREPDEGAHVRRGARPHKGGGARKRREKMESKMEGEEREGLVGAVFKVKTLSDPAHRFKVRKNAEQMHLTGIVIFHPAFSMVYVEGAGEDAARARGAEDVEVEVENDADADGASVLPDTAAASASASASTSVPGADGEFGTVSLAENRCDLVWEGALRERVFKGFRPRSCPTDAAAREALGVKMAGYWDTTKNWRGEEELV
ncbi:hypothetical protein BD410DRAFT_842705 [Rickenella mellea]|uniref:Uncharacterized protein n=1 Tax=Rickenella mellea TaxID=50990 RepID=A0A4Y7PUB7_9AGAM|nr:hypothetical protein BD410DRAFT_842705 [Rickenella mellea]